MAPLLALLLAAATPPTPSAAPVDPDPEARRALAAAARGDPPVALLQAAVARCADPASRGATAIARARAAALLPSLTAELRVDDRSTHVVGLQTSGEVDYTRRAPGWVALLRATWDLGALAAPPGERPTEKGLLDRARRIDDALRRATRLLFERRRLRLALALDPPADPRERAAALLAVERIGAELEALSCGALGGGR